MGEYGLTKAERLCGESAIGELFSHGRSGYYAPFRYVWTVRQATEEDSTAVSVLFSVPKKQLKRAVWRNVIKRRSREAYRLNKSVLVDSATANGKQLSIALIYGTKTIVDFKTVENGIKNILGQIGKNL